MHRHYETIRQQLRTGSPALSDAPRNTVVLYVEEVNAATALAVGYVRSFTGRAFRAIHVPASPGPNDIGERWQASCHTDVDLEVLPPSHNPTSAVIQYLRTIPRDRGDYLTVVIPELLQKRSLLSAVRRGPSFFLKVRLLSEPQVVITDVPVLAEGAGAPQRLGAMIPDRAETLVFVSGVHDAAERAINYARSLRSGDTRAVFFALDEGEVEQIQRDWAARRIPIALDIVEAPFRDLTVPILEEVRRVTARPGAIAAVVVPEIVVRRWWENLLHNQRAIFIKRLLLFEPGVILTSVPYQLR